MERLFWILFPDSHTMQYNTIQRYCLLSELLQAECLMVPTHTFKTSSLKSQDNNSNSKEWGKTLLINKYMKDPTDIKLHISHQTLPHYEVHLIKITIPY